MSYYNYINGQTPQYYQQQYTQPQQPMTNKLYVTSSEDALNRFAAPNTITVYFLQDESQIFEVTTDAQGRKNIRAKKLADIEPVKAKTDATNNFITRKEFDDFKGKLEGVLQEMKKR